MTYGVNKSVVKYSLITEMKKRLVAQQFREFTKKEKKNEFYLYV